MDTPESELDRRYRIMQDYKKENPTDVAGYKKGIGELLHPGLGLFNDPKDPTNEANSALMGTGLTVRRPLGPPLPKELQKHATGAVANPTPQSTTQPQLGSYGQPPTQSTPNLYRPGGPINQPPVGPTVLNTVQGQNPQVRRPAFGQYPRV